MQSKPLGPQTTLFTLEGEFDRMDKESAYGAVDAAIEGGDRWLLFDLSAVSFVDSVAVGVLLRAARETTARRGDVAVIGPRPAVLRVLEISGTREMLNVSASLAEAQQRLQLNGAAGTAEGEVS